MNIPVQENGKGKILNKIIMVGGFIIPFLLIHSTSLGNNWVGRLLIIPLWFLLVGTIVSISAINPNYYNFSKASKAGKILVNSMRAIGPILVILGWVYFLPNQIHDIYSLLISKTQSVEIVSGQITYQAVGNDFGLLGTTVEFTTPTGEKLSKGMYFPKRMITGRNYEFTIAPNTQDILSVKPI